ncbi:hypothetical protein [Oceaniglobus roseus]|uniref:hypothetical protein n=1 Tax=Oceaniglobus roseus TaxID=1737570 RepID=UPI000C7F5114|nr:hypothetical protein [Kandeliimicrobium roseum]
MVKSFLTVLVAGICLAEPACAQSLPKDLVGSWDVSPEDCARPGTSVTQVNISPNRIITFGGDALVREVERTGDVTFAAGDFRQTEGVPETAPRTREYFRLTQRDGPDHIHFVWKSVRSVDLVRCGSDRAESTSPEEAAAGPDRPVYDGPLPIPLGLWVIAGESCDAPADTDWRVYDGMGLRGASSRRCEIDGTEQQGESIVFSQLCEASYDGSVEAMRARITVTAPRRFALVEGGESEAQAFNWCRTAMHP